MCSNHQAAAYSRTVLQIFANTIKAKYKTITLILNNTTKVEPKIAKIKKARKSKKLIIKAADGQKLKASQFDKKGFKGTIVIKKSAMTRKQFRKLLRKLRKGGFRGKIRYKK